METDEADQAVADAAPSEENPGVLANLGGPEPLTPTHAFAWERDPIGTDSVLLNGFNDDPDHSVGDAHDVDHPEAIQDRP